RPAYSHEMLRSSDGLLVKVKTRKPESQTRQLKSEWDTDFHGFDGLTQTRSLRTTNPEILCKLPRIFLRGLLGAHASCVQGVGHPRHAGSVRSQGRNLRVLCVSAVRFLLVAAELLRVYLCSSV